MKRPIKTFVIAAATIAATTLQTIPTQACGPRGRGGVSIGYGRIGISVSRAPSYRPVHRPVYAQPQFAPSQPAYSQQAYSQPVYASQPARPITRQPVMQSNPVGNAPQPAPTRVAPSTAPAVANASTAPAGRAPTANTNEASALQMLSSMSSNDTTSSVATTSAENSTLIPQFTAPASTSSVPHAGTWKVNLPGNQSVELVLKDDSNFSWTATKDGKSSSFQGQFRLENGRLTLVRSNDLQQMAGTWSGQGSSFTFKLDGATTSGLAFVRSEV